MFFEITAAEEKHLSKIAQIERANFSLPLDEAMLRMCLGEQYVFLAAVEGDNVLGYVSMQYVLDEAYFNNIAVDSNFRKNGIADALLDKLDEEALKRDISFISLEVRKSNESAIALYLKHNYKEVGIRKNYYEKPTEDAIIMTKFLK